MQAYYKLNISRGDKVEITRDIKSFNDKLLIKSGSIGTYQGGSSVEGLILIEGKKRNIKVYYEDMKKV